MAEITFLAIFVLYVSVLALIVAVIRFLNRH